MAYSASIWAMVRSAYESGLYKSTREIAECPKLLKKCTKAPSAFAIHQKATRERWQKAKLAPQIEALTRENLVKSLAIKGVNAERIATKINEQLNAVRIVIDSSGEANTAIDNSAVDKAITQTAKIVGLYAPTQIENVTPEKLKRFIVEVSEIVLKHVSPQDVNATRDEIAALLAKYDSEQQQ
jgi:hypothetical protein